LFFVLFSFFFSFLELFLKKKKIEIHFLLSHISKLICKDVLRPSVREAVKWRSEADVQSTTSLLHFTASRTDGRMEDVRFAVSSAATRTSASQTGGGFCEANRLYVANDFVQPVFWLSTIVDADCF
jgi:hypothetical protein